MNGDRRIYRDKWAGFGTDEAEWYKNRHKQNLGKLALHKQQIYLIDKFVGLNTKWLDVPIGAAGLMEEINKGYMYGFDVSPKFVENALSLGIETKCGDVFNEDLASNHFDLITCFNFLFAHSAEEQRFLIRKFVRSLRSGGVLIFNVDSTIISPEINMTDPLCESDPILSVDRGWDRKEILELFSIGLDCEVELCKPFGFAGNISLEKKADKLLQTRGLVGKAFRQMHAAGLWMCTQNHGLAKIVIWLVGHCPMTNHPESLCVVRRR